MSNEKLEALMWATGAYVEPDGFQAVIGPNGELNGRAWATTKTMARGFVESHNRQIRAAHALGVEEGKREAHEQWANACGAMDVLCDALGIRHDGSPSYVMETAAKRLREAAPVDDGRNWRIWDRKKGVPSQTFPLTYTKEAADAIASGDGGDFWQARPVEPKHVHEWGQAYLDGHRNCLHCDARQVAEWKDEVTK